MESGVIDSVSNIEMWSFVSQKDYSLFSLAKQSKPVKVGFFLIFFLNSRHEAIYNIAGTDVI